MTSPNVAENIDFANEFPYDSQVIQEVFKEYIDKPVWVAFCVSDKKLPYNPNGGMPAKSNEASTWGTFIETLIFIQRQSNGKWLPGIALSGAEDLCVIDLDDVALEQEPILPDAKEIIDKLSTYGEYSTSGEGVHLYCVAKKPGTSCKANKSSLNPHGVWAIEIYDKKRFIIVTGKSRELHRPIRAAQSELDSIYLQHFPENTAEGERMSPFTPSMADEEVLALCRNEKNAAKFVKLFDDATKKRDCNDDSSKDQSIYNKLSFYTQNKEQIERIFISSNHYKTKDEPHKTKWAREDYRERTFNKALASCGAFYQPKRIHEAFVGQQQAGASMPTDEALAALGDDFKKAARLLMCEQNPCEEFSMEGFPQILQDYVKTISQTTDASPVMTFASCLGCISAYASKCYVQYFGKLYPNLYQLVLATSGGFKSTALKYGCYFAIENEKATVIEQRISNTAAASLGSKQEQTKEYQNILTRRALASRLLPAKTTAERLFKDLSRGLKGLLALSEFSDWLSSFDASYNKTLKATFTDLYDCPDFYEVRTVGNEADPIVITNPYISILGFSAPEWIEGQVSDKDVMKGFFSRFLLFYVKEPAKRPKAWPDAPFTPPAEFKNILEKIAKCEGEYKLTPEAQEQFTVIFNAVYDILDEKKDSRALLEPFIKRWCPSIIKVALLLHLAESPSVREIQAKHIRAAAKYVGCAIKSTLYIFKSGLLESEFQRNCTAILKFIAERGGKATRKAIFTSHRIKTKKDDNIKTYDEIMEFLMESGQIAVITTDKRNDWIYYLVGSQDETDESKMKKSSSSS